MTRQKVQQSLTSHL